MPVLVAPMAMHGLAHPGKELATARAAAAQGVPMVSSALTAEHNMRHCPLLSCPSPLYSSSRMIRQVSSEGSLLQADNPYSMPPAWIAIL